MGVIILMGGIEVNKSEIDVQATEWYQTRPRCVQARIDTHPPNRLYRMKDTGQIVPIYSYGVHEDGECHSCTVLIFRQYNPATLVERTVFGVDFENLDMLSPEEEKSYLG